MNDIRKSINNISTGLMTKNGELLHITISIGISDLQSESEEVYQAIRRADAALYQAKQVGRNTVKVKVSNNNNIIIGES